MGSYGPECVKTLGQKSQVGNIYHIFLIFMTAVGFIVHIFTGYD